MYNLWMDIILNHWIAISIIAAFFGSVGLFLMSGPPRHRFLYFAFFFSICSTSWIFIHEARQTEHYKEAKAAAWAEKDSGVEIRPFR